MASLVKGHLRIPVWLDGDKIKPLVNDDGRIPVVLESSGITMDVNLASSAISLDVNLKTSSITLDVNLASSGITLPVSEQSPLSNIQARDYGWDLTNWRKLPLLWGYHDRVVENMGETKDGAGTFNKLSTAVPAGEIHVIQLMTIRNNSGDRGAVSTYLFDGTYYYCLKWSTSSTRYDAQLITGTFVLKEGDRVNVRMALCQNGDDIEGGIWGYKMSIVE